MTYKKGLCRWCSGTLGHGACELTAACGPALGLPHAHLLYADILRECFGVDLKINRERAVCSACIRRLSDAWQFKRGILRAERNTGDSTVRNIVYSVDSLARHDASIFRTVVLPCRSKLSTEWTTSHSTQPHSTCCDVKVEWITADEDVSTVSESRADNLALECRSPGDIGLDEDLQQNYDGTDSPSNSDPIKTEVKKNAYTTESSFTKEATVRQRPGVRSAATVVRNDGRNTGKIPDKNVNASKKMKISLVNFVRPTVGVQKKKATKIFTPISFKSITVKPKTYNLQPIRTAMDTKGTQGPGHMAESNAALIIQYSYVCPFKCKYNDYLCFYCGQSFLEPELLREHTLKDHNASRPQASISSNRLTKIDITRINCRLCTEHIQDLETLKGHLTKEHNKTFCTGTGDGVLPFLLSKPLLKCAYCDESFPYFHALNQHINEHFPNFVCETCGLGFVDQTRLQVHKAKHEKKVCPCVTCGRSFSGTYALKVHIDRVHKRRGRICCPVCPEIFLSHEKKMDHLANAHGRERDIFKCADCEKMLPSRRALTLHRRREHLNDYRYECRYCGKKFFTKAGLGNHTPTHTGERHYRCDTCAKSFPRKKALAVHARTHDDDRGFVCTV